MGVKARYPKAYAEQLSVIPGMPHLGQSWVVWDGNNALLGQGKTEGDAWYDAYQYIVRQEGRCP